MELCACTLRQGLGAQGNPFPPVIQRGLDMLWNCLKEQMVSTDMQDFANDLYACSLEHNVGEDLTDTQEVFFKSISAIQRKAPIAAVPSGSSTR